MLGEHLQRLGHDVAVYAPELGPFADHARRRGVAVTDRVRELPETCDVVFSQDGIVVYDLAERFPDAFHAYRICGDVMDFQLPPQTADVVDLLVVLSDRYERIARAAAVPPRCCGCACRSTSTGSSRSARSGSSPASRRCSGRGS